jgi:hypothetical protein
MSILTLFEMGADDSDLFLLLCNNDGFVFFC